MNARTVLLVSDVPDKPVKPERLVTTVRASSGAWTFST